MNLQPKALPINIGFERIKDTHTLYQLIPDATIDNVHCSDELVKALHQVNRDLKDRIKRDGMKWSCHRKDVTTYEILLSKQQIKFTLAIPTRYDSFIQNKVKNSWGNIGVAETEDYIHVFENDNSLTCDLELKNHFFMSLLTDGRSHSPLGSVLNVTHGLMEDDKLLFQLLLEPINNWWHESADSKYEAYRQGKDVTSSRNFLMKAYIWFYENIIDYVVEIIEDIFEAILDVEPVKKEKKHSYAMRGTNSIKTDKTMYEGFNTRIRLFSYSQNDIRRRENLNSLIVAFRTLDGDNALKPTDMTPVIKIKREMGRYSFLFPQVLNTKEIQQMVTLPNKTMQRQYKQLKAIANTQTDLPQQAFDEYLKMGLYNRGGQEVPVSFSSKNDDLAQSKALVCTQGGGKTTFMQNYIYEVYKLGQPLIVIDYVQDCELTNEVLPYLDRSRVEVINLHNYSESDNILGLGYNEVRPLLESKNPRDRLKGANFISAQLCELLNGVTFGATEPLSSQMLKYLSSACRVVFATTPQATIMDVYYCLEDCDIRSMYVSKAIANNIYSEDHVDIKNLLYLTKDDKGESSTRMSDIKGIMNRFAGIQSLDLRLIEFFSSPVDNSIDFNRYIDENKIVFIQIPQTEFTDDCVRDILTTFFCTKLWLTCQTRKGSQLKLTHLLLDEVKMIPNTSDFLAKYITQFRRHRLSTLFACHNLNQFQHALSSINSSGLNLFILSGVKREAVKSIEDDLVSFSWDEIKELKPRHALVTTTYDNEKFEFVVHLQDKFFKLK
jgi:hypothetical protein